MGKKTHTRQEARLKQQSRVRSTVQGTNAKPRLCVFRSHRYTYAQLTSDEGSNVLGAVSSKTLVEKSAKSVESAKLVGQKIAEIAKEKNITSIVFDRNGYIYHGRVAAVAAGAREAGLVF